jgi:predicted NBD/HSP70 family sugar kinase
VGGSVLVDNDVNWAARAERDARASDTVATLDDFVYLHLGEGLGCAVVSDGEVRRGHSGLAGEIAHLTVAGVDGRAVTFTDIFQQLGLRRAGSTAIDVEALLAAVAGGPDGPSLVETLAAAVGDVITSAIAFCDPRLIVVGGGWGTAVPVFHAVQTRTSALARSVSLDLATAGADSALAGARSTAMVELRADIIARSRTP